MEWDVMRGKPAAAPHFLTIRPAWTGCIRREVTEGAAPPNPLVWIAGNSAPSVMPETASHALTRL